MKGSWRRPVRPTEIARGERTLTYGGDEARPRVSLGEERLSHRRRAILRRRSAATIISSSSRTGSPPGSSSRPRRSPASSGGLPAVPEQESARGRHRSALSTPRRTDWSGVLLNATGNGGHLNEILQAACYLRTSVTRSVSASRV